MWQWQDPSALEQYTALAQLLQTLNPLHAALKRYRGTPPHSPSQVPSGERSPPALRPHSAPAQGSLQQGRLLQGSLQEGSLQEGSLQEGSLQEGRTLQGVPWGSPQQGTLQQGSLQQGQQELWNDLLPDRSLGLQQQTWPGVYNEDPWAFGGSVFNSSVIDRASAAAAEPAQSQPQSGNGAGSGAQGHFQGQPFMLGVLIV